MTNPNPKAVLLSLIDALQKERSWSGETHIQKCSYFLQEALDVHTQYKFILYRHGPFSFDLREELGEMRGLFMIDVESREPYGPSIHVTESGKKYLSRFPRSILETQDQVVFIAKQLGSKDVAHLERLGTAFYMKRLHPDAEDNDLVKEMLKVKPHIDEKAAFRAVEEVDRMVSSFESDLIPF
jgi:hypothetical protein